MSLTYADANGDLIETLDAELRCAVRAEGVDPQRDASLVRRLAGQVVGDHDQRSLTGAVLPVDDHDGVVEELVARVSGFGALQRYLDDPTVEEVWINHPVGVTVSRVLLSAPRMSPAAHGRAACPPLRPPRSNL